MGCELLRVAFLKHVVSLFAELCKASFCQEMDGILPDTRTFGILIDACAKRGDLEKADVWLHRADGAGKKHDVITFKALLNAAAREGHLSNRL